MLNDRESTAMWLILWLCLASIIASTVVGCSAVVATFR